MNIDVLFIPISGLWAKHSLYVQANLLACLQYCGQADIDGLRM